MSSPIVEVHDLSRVYPAGGGASFRVVNRVSFEVPDGGALAIVGESGAGKSTLARMIAGLEQPCEESIMVAGNDRSSVGRGARQRHRRGRELQIVFQDPYTSLDPWQSATDCVGEVVRLHDTLDRRARGLRIDQLLDQGGLDSRSRTARPRSLSGGQRQRVAIARALAARSSVLLLVETVSALDVSIQAQVLNLLAEIRESDSLTYIRISHDLAGVRQLCDDILMLRKGSVVEQGSASAVLDEPVEPYTRRLRASVRGPGWTPRRTGDLEHPKQGAL